MPASSLLLRATGPVPRPPPPAPRGCRGGGGGWGPGHLRQVVPVLADDVAPEVVFELTHRCHALLVVGLGLAKAACGTRRGGRPAPRPPASASGPRGRPARSRPAPASAAPSSGPSARSRPPAEPSGRL